MVGLDAGLLLLLLPQLASPKGGGAAALLLHRHAGVVGLDAGRLLLLPHCEAALGSCSSMPPAWMASSSKAGGRLKRIGGAACALGDPALGEATAPGEGATGEVPIG